MNFFTDQMGCLADGILTVMFFNIFMERKNPSFPHSCLMVGVVFFYINLANTILEHFYLSNPVIIFCDLMIAILFYRSKIWTKVIMVLFLNLVTVICELLTTVLLMLMGWNFSDMIDDTMVSILATFIAKISILFLIKIMDKLWKNKNIFLPKEYWVLLFSIFFIGFFILFSISYYVFILNLKIEKEMVLLFSIYIFFSSSIIFFLFEKMSKFYQYKNKAELLEKQMLTERNHVNEVTTLNERMSMIRHDMKNHILTIQTLLDKGESANANTYANSVLKQIEENKLEYDTGNVALDALLNSKYHTIKEKHIHFSQELQIESPINISDIDMCMVIANGLDNAIEACNQVEDPKERSIYLEMEVNEDVVMVHIKNTFTVNPKKFKGIFLTGKNNLENHGYGIEIMKQIASQNKGFFDASFDDTYFSVSIILKNKSPE